MSSLRMVKVLRDLWLHRARTMMVVVAIVVGLAGAGSVLDAWSLLRRATRDGYMATIPASATLRVDSVDDALLHAVRAMPTVREAEARRTIAASIQIKGGWSAAMLFASPAPATRQIGRLVHEQGSWPPDDGTFVIERSSMGFAGLSVGDSVLVRVGEGAPVRLPITGVVRDAGLAPGWMEHVVYGFVSPATLARLGAPTPFDQVAIVTRDGSLDRRGVRAVTAEVSGVITSLGHSVRAVDVPEPGQHIHAGQMNSLLLTMGAFGLLTLAMSAFLVVNLMTAMLAGQLREIGVMKSMGARPSQLAAMYLGLALALGILASLIALPLAAYAGRAYAGFSATMLNFTTDGIAIPRLAIAAQVVIGLLLPVLAAAFPVLRGCRIPVTAALRDVGISDEGASPAWLDRIRGPRRPLLLSLRNAFRRRGRMALTLLTLSLGGAAFLGALDLRAGIRRSIGIMYGEALRHDMSVRPETPHDVDSLAAVAVRVPGVEVAEVWSGVHASVAGDDGLEGSFNITGIPMISQLVKLPVLAGRALRQGDDSAIVVTPVLLDAQPALALGQQALLTIGGRTGRWTIVGVVDAGPMPSAFTYRTSLAHWTGDPRATSLLVRAQSRDTAAQSALLGSVRAEMKRTGFPVGSSQLMESSRRVIEDHLLMVASFLLAMAQLAVVVGGLGLASTMSLAVLERTREIGVLRAIGAAPRAIMGIVQAEGLVVALLSWAIAIPLSMPVSVLLGQAFARIMIPVPVTLLPNGAALAEWFVLVVVVSVAACAWPASRATRIPAVEALSYE